MIDREEVQIRRGGQVIRQAGLREYLQELTGRLAGDHRSDVRTYPVRSPWFNATMAPNGMMQVWSGLLLRAENEAQLATVLGHELGHYLQRHSLQRLQDFKSRSAGALVAGLFGAAGAVIQLGLSAGMFAFSRDQEREADAIGMMLMKQQGYDLSEAAKIWVHLRSELSAGSGGDPAQRSVLFSSHPPTDERERNLNQLAEKLGTGGERGDDAYQRYIAALMPDMLADELGRGQYEETIQLMGRLASTRPHRADVLVCRAQARRLRNQGRDLELAEADLRAALVREACPPAAHRELGYILRSRQQLAQARESLQRYIDLAPSAPDAGLIRNDLNDLP